MKENKDALYREEFEKYYFEDYKVSYNESDKLHFETYLAGRHKGQEEIEILKIERIPVEIHSDEVSSWKMSVDRLVLVNKIKDEKIESLKKEIDRIKADKKELQLVIGKLEKDIVRGEHVDSLWLRDLFPEATENQKLRELVERARDLLKYCNPTTAIKWNLDREQLYKDAEEVLR